MKSGYSKNMKIKKNDLKGCTLEEMLTKQYGKPGTKKRIAADARIKKAEANMVKERREKIAAHKQYQVAQTGLYSLVFTDVDKIFTKKQIEKIKKFKKIVDSYQKKYYNFL